MNQREPLAFQSIAQSGDVLTKPIGQLVQFAGVASLFRQAGSQHQMVRAVGAVQPNLQGRLTWRRIAGTLESAQQQVASAIRHGFSPVQHHIITLAKKAQCGAMVKAELHGAGGPRCESFHANIMAKIRQRLLQARACHPITPPCAGSP